MAEEGFEGYNVAIMKGIGRRSLKGGWQVKQMRLQNFQARTAYVFSIRGNSSRQCCAKHLLEFAIISKTMVLSFFRRWYQHADVMATAGKCLMATT